MRRLQDRSFLAFVIAVTLLFAWILQPFFGAILWGIVAAILFTPVNDCLLRAWPTHRNAAAAITLLLIVAMVIVPAILLGISLLREASWVYAQIQSGDIDFGRYFMQAQAALPDWANSLLGRFGLTDFDAVRTRLGAGITNSFQQLAAQAFNLGQSALGFLVALGVMLYLTFFLLRDGKALATHFETTVPLHAEQRRAIFDKFITVIHATIKGSVIVAILQGFIGGIVFWSLGIHAALLWGVSMGFLSLLPAIGTGIIWVPVAAYLLLTGSIWEGVALVFCGVFIIGLVDNVLRPILVGRDTRLPDYVVLISTLGGLEVFGFNGFIIGPVVAALFMAVWENLARQNSRAEPASTVPTRGSAAIHAEQAPS